MYIRMYVMYVCMLCMCVYMYVCNVSMYVCNVCMYVCMYSVKCLFKCCYMMMTQVIYQQLNNN